MRAEVLATARVELEYVCFTNGGEEHYFWDAVYESEKKSSPAFRGESPEDCLKQVVEWLQIGEVRDSERIV